MQSSSKRLLAMGLAILTAAVAWYLITPSNHHQSGSHANRSNAPHQPERYHPRNDLGDEQTVSRPPQPMDEPDAGLVYVRGKGWMKKMDDPNAVPPPAKEELPQKKDAEKPEPLKPVTPAWKLKMKTRLLGDMERRIGRIRKALEDARKAGDAEAVHRNEILLERTKMRTKRLRSDVELLKQHLSNEQDPNQRKDRP